MPLGSSQGGAAVSNTDGRGFDSFRACDVSRPADLVGRAPREHLDNRRDITGQHPWPTCCRSSVRPRAPRCQRGGRGFESRRWRHGLHRPHRWWGPRRCDPMRRRGVPSSTAVPAGRNARCKPEGQEPASPHVDRFTDRARGRRPAARTSARHAEDAGSTPADHTTHRPMRPTGILRHGTRSVFRPVRPRSSGPRADPAGDLGSAGAHSRRTAGSIPAPATRSHLAGVAQRERDGAQTAVGVGSNPTASTSRSTDSVGRDVSSGCCPRAAVESACCAGGGSFTPNDEVAGSSPVAATPGGVAQSAERETSSAAWFPGRPIRSSQLCRTGFLLVQP